MNFGKKILDARKKANLSQEEIAEKLNITSIRCKKKS